MTVTPDPELPNGGAGSSPAAANFAGSEAYTSDSRTERMGEANTGQDNAPYLPARGTTDPDNPDVPRSPNQGGGEGEVGNTGVSGAAAGEVVVDDAAAFGLPEPVQGGGQSGVFTGGAAPVDPNLGVGSGGMGPGTGGPEAADPYPSDAPASVTADPELRNNGQG